MNPRPKGSSPADDKHFPFWRSSLYEEPLWVSLAWIIGPLLLAGTALYLLFR